MNSIGWFSRTAWGLVELVELGELGEKLKRHIKNAKSENRNWKIDHEAFIKKILRLEGGVFLY